MTQSLFFSSPNRAFADSADLFGSEEAPFMSNFMSNFLPAPESFPQELYSCFCDISAEFSSDPCPPVLGLPFESDVDGDLASPLNGTFNGTFNGTLNGTLNGTTRPSPYSFPPENAGPLLVDAFVLFPGLPAPAPQAHYLRPIYPVKADGPLCGQLSEPVSLAPRLQQDMGSLMRKRQRSEMIGGATQDRRKIIASRLQALSYLLSPDFLAYHRPRFLSNDRWEEIISATANGTLIRIQRLRGNALTLRVPEAYDQIVHLLVNDGSAHLNRNPIAAPSRFRWWSDAHFDENDFDLAVTNKTVGGCVDRTIEFPAEICSHPFFQECYTYDQPLLLAQLSQFFRNCLEVCLHHADIVAMQETGFGRARKRIKVPESDLPAALRATIDALIVGWNNRCSYR